MVEYYIRLRQSYPNNIFHDVCPYTLSSDDINLPSQQRVFSVEGNGASILKFGKKHFNFFWLHSCRQQKILRTRNDIIQTMCFLKNKNVIAVIGTVDYI